MVDLQLFEMQFGIFFLKTGDQGFYFLTVFAPVTIEINSRDGAAWRRTVAG